MTLSRLFDGGDGLEERLGDERHPGRGNRSVDPRCVDPAKRRPEYVRFQGMDMAWKRSVNR